MKEDIRLKLFNTETRQLEEIAPIDGHTIRMYTCGPTVYNFAHIGNLRTFVFEDVMRRTIKFFGYKIFHVMNLTDVDDKTIKGALDNDVSLVEFTDPFIEAFFEDLKTIHVEPAEQYPRATDFIPDMIRIIQRLLDREIAYVGFDGSIYYSIAKFPKYGRLSHLKLDELQAGGAANSADEYDKHNISDFVLWKRYDPERDGSIFWDSPFGPGRPGWHIECSAMSMKLLGETFDIHAGGVDNMFPHHENEIAQSEAYSCKTFAKHWIHAEHLLVDHKKMSKSLGNFYTLRDLLKKGYTGSQIRYVLLQTHYRIQLNFTFASLDAAASALERLGDFVARLRRIEKKDASGLVEPLLEDTYIRFKTALGDDLNTSASLAALFDFVREMNALCDRDQVSKLEAESAIAFLHKLDSVLAFIPFEEPSLSIPSDLQEALEKREAARTAKNWKDADHYRDLILSRGYLIEDTPSGARLKKKS